MGWTESNRVESRVPMANRASSNTACTDPIVGAILAGWRYDISSISPEMHRVRPLPPSPDRRPHHRRPPHLGQLALHPRLSARRRHHPPRDPHPQRPRPSISRSPDPHHHLARSRRHRRLGRLHGPLDARRHGHPAPRLPQRRRAAAHPAGHPPAFRPPPRLERL
jgi:hypothetical protein